MEDTAVSGTVLRNFFAHDAQNNRYAYVLLPTLSASETVAFSQNPSIEVIAQDSNMHAVYDTEFDVLGAFSWDNVQTTNAYLTAEGQFTLLAKIEGLSRHIWLSQPTRANEAVKVKFNDRQCQSIQSDTEKRVTW
ncbi:polysaccharide lyase beta-sandwich domain-containing protein [Enterovibrio nigricans]|nr:polysaccharide lyase beta-sandwich domain-containing protein [Enterovibrio nigricans]